MQAHIKQVLSVLLLLPLLFFTERLMARDDIPTFLNVDKINQSQPFAKNVLVAYLDNNYSIYNSYLHLKFQQASSDNGLIPINSVTKKNVLKFGLMNSADTAVSVWFFPGFYAQDISLFIIKGEVLFKYPSIRPPGGNDLCFRKISIPPHDSLLLLAEIKMIKAETNRIFPHIIPFNQLSDFVLHTKNTSVSKQLGTYVFCGILLMMTLLAIANFWQQRQIEFLYYAGYASLMGLMLLGKAIFISRSTPFSNFFESYLDYVMMVGGLLFYMLFMRTFLSSKQNHPFLYTLYNCGIAFLLLSVSVYSYLYFFSDKFLLQILTENLSKILLLCMVVIFLVYCFKQRKKDLQMQFLFWGNFSLLIFSVLSLVKIMMKGIQFPGLLNSSVTIYEIGLFLDLIFFLFAINIKTNRKIIQQTKEKINLQTEKKIKEQFRISEDIHGELGAGLTAIRLTSEIAKNKMKDNVPDEIQKISNSASEELTKINAIIWSMNQRNDPLDSMLSYIREYSQEYFENTPIKCKISTPSHIPPIKLSGEKRISIFLSLQETLNNCLKHSNASEVDVDIKIEKDLVVKIIDNGKGISPQQLEQRGTGHKSIARKMESIGGSFKLENNKNSDGCLSTLTLPV